MFILHRPAEERVSAAVFDFDGTVSTLRCGWEEVMGPLMAETLCAVSPEPEESVRKRVAAYINGLGLAVPLNVPQLYGAAYSAGPEIARTFVVSDIQIGITGEEGTVRDLVPCGWNEKLTVSPDSGVLFYMI